MWTGVAHLVVPLFTGPHIPAGLTAGLSQVLFPVVLLLSLTGLLVGILQAYDQFTIPALAPAVWNLVILRPAGRPALAVPRREPDLRVRDRVARGDASCRS